MVRHLSLHYSARARRPAMDMQQATRLSSLGLLARPQLLGYYRVVCVS